MAFPATNSQKCIRKRKRHFNEISIIKLILLGCCLTLCKNSLLAQAIENIATSNNNTASSKGENMLLSIKEDHLASKQDLANDSEGTFKRLKPLDYKDLTAKVEEDLKLIGEEDTEEIDEHSSEVIEMIQPAHNLRHQEHYKQRIIMAAKQQENHHNNDDDIDNIKQNGNNGNNDNDDDHNEDYDEREEQDEEISQHNRNLRYQQIQLALREPITSSTPPTPNQQTQSQEQHYHHHHHRRHEHHLFRQNQAKQTEFLWPQPHHLRHQHQHHKQQQQQQQFQPQLHHGFNPIRKQNLTNVSVATKSKLPSRYFDRESSATNPWSKMFTTEGPHLRHSKSSSQFWRSKTYKTNPHNRLYNDDNFLNLETNNKENSPDKNDNKNNDDNDDVEGEGEREDIKRFSLPLEGQEIYKEIKQKTNTNDNDPEISNNKNQEGEGENEGENEDDDDDDDDDDEDYSYEDDDKEINKSLKYPTITAQSKTNVKRYTRPLNRPYVSSSSYFSSSSYGQRSSLLNTPHLRHTASTIKKNSNQNNDNDDDDYEEDDIIESSMDKTSANENVDNDNNDNDDSDSDEDKFSDEKWNKIEHEHYRKQLQHQRAMQALRAKRPATTTTTNINNNPPTININRYASYTPPGSSASYNSAWTKRQTNNNEDESENIYSRYYVPGSVTRKKEEELGSPTAILEARRQYALQQRKNKALASAHHRRIVTEGSCRLPQPRVERIRRDSWKIYTPHCTILHRCADDAGCCPSERQTCAPKRTKEVDLYFFVISLNETQGSIEKLTFVNHTECHCVERSKQRAPEYGSSSAKDINFNNQIPFLRRATILNCHCPNLFEKILQEDGYCRCDCSSGNMGCDWLKRGMEHFSMNDRKCIMEGRCKLPTCEYGQYIKKHGRCPRREERHLTADVDW